MKISVFTTATNPQHRGDLFLTSLKNYLELADELVVVDGSKQKIDYLMWSKNSPLEYNEHNFRHTRWTREYWPKEFSWEFIGQQFQRGYEASTGDWVIHADLDFIFHEQDYAGIRKALEDNPDAPALSFWKYQFMCPNRYNLKSRLVIAVNKGKYGDRIRFDSGGDLCQPSLDGKEIKPDSIPEARIPFYNYEKILKTKEQIKDDVERMDRAYKRYFGKNLYSSDERSAYDGWMKMAIGRASKPQEEVSLSFHPRVMHDTLRNLKPDQFGYNGFGQLPICKYIDTL